MRTQSFERGERRFVAAAWFLSMVSWIAVLLGEFGVLRAQALVPLAVLAAVATVVGFLRSAPSPAGSGFEDGALADGDFANRNPAAGDPVDGDPAGGGPANVARRDNAPRESDLPTLVSMAVILVICVALFFPPYETFLWASDSTVYLNLGQEMSRNGGFRLHDPIVTEIPAAMRAEVFRNQNLLDVTGELVRLPGGFRIESVEKPEVFAGFSPVFPSLNAVVFVLFGAAAMPYLASIFATLSILGLFLLARALAGAFAGWAAALVALCTMPQLWFGRFSMPEIVAEFFVVAGMLALAMATVRRSRLLAAAGGWMTGIAALTKFELIPILILALATWIGLGLLLRSRRPPSTTLWFAAACSIPLLHAGVHYSLWPTHYRLFVEVLVAALPLVDRVAAVAGRGGLPAMVLPVVVVMAICATVFARSGRARAAAAAPRLWGALLLMPLVIYFPGYFLAAENQITTTAAWLGWYLSWPALAALAAGIAVFLYQSRQRWAEGNHRHRPEGEVTMFILVLLGVAGAQIVYNPQSTGEHIWSARRLVPVIVPMAAVLLGVLVLEPLRKLRPRAGPLAAALVLAILGAVIAMPTLIVVRQSLWQGSRDTSAAVAALIPERGRVIVSAELAGTHLATTLNYTHEIPTLVLRPRQRIPTVIGSVIERWLDDDRPVLLIAGGRPFSFFAPQLRMVGLGGHSIDISILERAHNRPPEKIVRDVAAISVFRVYQRTEQRTGVDIGDPTDDSFFQLGGFYEAERDQLSGARSFRWTTAQASMLLPAVSGLRLTLASSRPPGEPAARVSIYLDGVPLVQDIEVGNDVEQLTFDQLPPVPSSTPSPVARQLAITSSVFVPEEVGLSPTPARWVSAYTASSSCQGEG